MRTVGRGAREIRIRDESGAFRVIYVAKVEDRVYTCCMPSRRKRRRPEKQISTWPKNDTKR
jgi:phage-related protein